MNKNQCRSRGLLIAIVLAAVFITRPVSAQDLTAFERVLVPVSVTGVPGAYGTIWSTELWYRNNGPAPVAMFPTAIADFVPTIGRTSPLVLGSHPAIAPGAIVYISRAGAEKVQFDLRLYNRADSESGWGTQIPVVREYEFRDIVDLLSIPTDSAFRTTVRIYGLTERVAYGEPVRIDIYSYNEQPLMSADLALSGWPAYAELVLPSYVLSPGPYAERVRVRVSSSNSDVKIWAFASVVSNATQNVGIVTP